MENLPSDLNHELRKALSDGDIKMIRSLIKKGADINQVFVDELDDGNYQLIIPLLDNGANINTIDSGGYNVMDIIAMELSRRYYNPDDPENKKRSDKLLEIIKYLFDHNAPRENVILLGQNEHDSLFDEAIHFGYYDIVKYLLERGFDPNELAGSGETPLDAAIRQEYYSRRKKMVEILLQYGADPNYLGSYWDDSLLEFVVENEPSWIELLIDYDADPNLPENKLLIFKILKSNDPVLAIKSLISGGANINVRNKHGETFLSWLEDYSVHGNYESDKEKAKKILSYLSPIFNENPSSTDMTTGINNLMIAAHKGQLDRLNLYFQDTKFNDDSTEPTISKGIFYKIRDIDAEDQLGNTALHYAAVGKNKRAIKFLLNKGANPLIKNKGGHFPKISLADLPQDYSDVERKAFQDNYLRTIIGGYFSVIPKDLIGEIGELL